MRSLGCLLTVHLLFCLHAVAADAWSASYEANEPPDKAVPRFHVHLSEGAEARARDGVLALTSATGSRSAAYLAVGQNMPSQHVKERRWGDATAWDGSRPAVVEARMRVVRLLGGCELGAMIQASDGRRYWILSLAPQGVCTPRGRVAHKLDATQFHTYRIALDGAKARLMVDGKELPPTLLSQGTCVRNALLFGDFSSGVSGVSEWDFIRWRSERAKLWKEPVMPTLWAHGKVELCGPKIGHPFSTGGSAVVLGDGRVVLFYAGPTSPHGQKPGTTRCYVRASADGGATWGPEREIIHHPECQACGPSALRARDGTLWVFYMGFYVHAWQDGEPLMDKTRSDLWAACSKDDGQTWTDGQMLFRGYTGATNGAIETSKGRLVVPFSYVVPNPGRLVSACVVSADGGKTWTLSSGIDLGGHGDHAGAIEPAVVELEDGRIWMLIRTTKGSFWQSFSTDNGLTWGTPTPTSIQSPSAPCHITRLGSGRLALVWNNTMATTKGRDTLSMALSDDDGKTWTVPLECVRSGQLSYPHILEAAPGQLLVGCNHVMGGWRRVTPVVFRIAEQTLLEHK